MKRDVEMQCLGPQWTSTTDTYKLIPADHLGSGSFFEVMCRQQEARQRVLRA